jgi:hypothetical protein
MTTTFMMNLSELRLTGHFGFVPSAADQAVEADRQADFPPTLLGHTGISIPSVIVR